MINDRISIPNRLQGACIERVRDTNEWIVWLHTPDFVHGTFLHLHADGKVTRVTVTEDESDREFLVRPSDK